MVGWLLFCLCLLHCLNGGSALAGDSHARVDHKLLRREVVGVDPQGADAGQLGSNAKEPINLDSPGRLEWRLVPVDFLTAPAERRFNASEEEGPRSIIERPWACSSQECTEFMASKSASSVDAESCFPQDPASAVAELRACARKYLSGVPANVPTASRLPLPMYIIHGRRHQDRWFRLQEMFKIQQIDNEVVWLNMFEGSNLSNVTSPINQCLFTIDYITGMGADHGAAASWADYSLYRHIVEKNLPHVMVMEDDPAFNTKHEEAHLADRLREMWQSISKANIPVSPNVSNTSNVSSTSNVSNGMAYDFDLMFFGGCQNIHGWKPLVDGLFTGPTSRCANGYVISQAGARKMLAIFRKRQPHQGKNMSRQHGYADKIPWAIDWMFDMIGTQDIKTPGCGRLKAAVLEPPLFDNGEH